MGNIKLKRARELKEMAFGKHVPIRQKIFYMFFMFSFIAGTIGTIINYAIGSSLEPVMMTATIALISPPLALWGLYTSEKQDIFMLVGISGVNFFLFPLLYLTGGAIESGIPAFFVLGIAVTLFMFTGKRGIILAILESIYYLFIFAVSFFHPAAVMDIPAFETADGIHNFSFNAVMTNTFMVATFIGFLTKMLFKMYQKENKLVTNSIAEIKRLSTIDPLTNVYNRRYMYTYLTEQVNIARTEKTPLSVALFDIDKFKLLNDTYGHLLGDDVLKALSHILKNACRPGEIVARYGGEEFIMVLPGLDNEAAYKRANEIRECLEQSYLSPELPKDKPVTISGGVSTYTDGLNEEKLVAIADENLYKAKENGRNRIMK